MHGLNEIVSINAWAAKCAEKRKAKQAKLRRVKASLVAAAK